MTPPPKDPPQPRTSTEERKAPQRPSQAIKPLPRRPAPPEVDDDDSPDEVARKLIAQLRGARTTVDDIRDQQAAQLQRYEGLAADIVEMNVEMTKLSLRLDQISQQLERAQREREAAQKAADDDARERARMEREHRSKRAIAIISLLGMIAVAVITGLVTIIVKS